MNDDAQAELRVLRARVYGPDADISADAGAHARLRELEAHARDVADAPLERAVVPAAPEAPAGVVDIEELFAQADAPEPDPAPLTAGVDAPIAAPTGFFSRIRPTTRPMALAWAASLAAVAVLAGAVTYAIVGLIPDPSTSGARQVATLGEMQRAEDAIAQSWFGQSGDTRAYTYRGLTVLTTDQGWESGQQACIMVAPTDGVNWQDNTISGQLYSGCSAGAFPATAEFTVQEIAPSELREAHPVGTSLQFVMVEDQIAVFVDGGGTPTSASR